MKLDELRSLFRNRNDVHDTAQQLSKEGACVHLQGLIGTGRALVAEAIIHATPGKHLFILPEKEDAAYFLNDLQGLCEEDFKILFYPASYRSPYSTEQIDNSNVVERAEVLNQLSRGNKYTIIVSYPEAISESVVTLKHLKQNTMAVKVGETYTVDFLNELLIEYHFDKVDYVYEPGQFAVRGGIMDVFSFVNDLPFRIEFFGDEVASIRIFDPSSQISVQEVKNFSIVPNIQHKLLHESRQPFLEFLSPDSYVWLTEYELIKDKIGATYERACKAFEALESPLDHMPPEGLYLNEERLQEWIFRFRKIELGPRHSFTADITVDFIQVPQTQFNKNFDMLRDELAKNHKDNWRNLIFAGAAQQIERLYAAFEDHEEAVEFTPLMLNLHEGFRDKNLKLSCFTDHQIFERYHKFRLKEGFRESKQALTLKELGSLQKGDYIVHIDHGIGVFSGLEKVDNNGKVQEAIRLVYKDSDVLYVSIHSLHRISKYTGKEGAIPRVDKLGGAAWQTLKSKTKKKVKELAFDLIKLYAERKGKKGFAFSPDSYLQHELEASFIYEDTPDQEKATIAVKEDMEGEAPMDRLVCGDVGFGKTEIAIRAAFKAVADSKQVAILVPTTILCLQHYKSFSERLKSLPCTVDYVNRFKSAAQIKESLNKLKAGQTDIIIGTHRLVSKDVKFKDLGLLVIDEEQKFGVNVKDKLKVIKSDVDTLTLTATPIPRTLQFSMMGARDLSIINTPPPNRYPIQTELSSFGEEVIRNAINYEISRGGQVFFVHNRVENIGEMAVLIGKLCPKARIGVGHGQMPGPKLEAVMLDFVEGHYDVLLATTIIESGLDIPNANTILINNAQNFGLSDLHQLRGRVGRSNKKAFCYLLAPPLSVLSSDARRRLSAIQQFSDLGSGLNVAMRDLDIRGAGNLLGGEQSGFIGDIGFEAYQKILDEAIHELKETEFKELFQHERSKQHMYVLDCQIDTDLELLLPDTYVNIVEERIRLYRELDEIENEQALALFGKQLQDRFGPIPDATNELMDTVRLRWMARKIAIEKIVLKQNKMICYFVQNQESEFYQSALFTNVLSFVQHNHRMCKMEEKKDRLSLVLNKISTISEAMRLMQSLAGIEAPVAQSNS